MLTDPVPSHNLRLVRDVPRVQLRLVDPFLGKFAKRKSTIGIVMYIPDPALKIWKLMSFK